MGLNYYLPHRVVVRNLRSGDLCKALSTVSVTQVLSCGSNHGPQLGAEGGSAPLSGSENVDALYMTAQMD